MADVAVPVLPDLPEGLHWLLTKRSAGSYGITGRPEKGLLPGSEAPAADRKAAAKALILPGTHFLSSDGSVRVEIPEPLGTLARFSDVNKALLQRADAGDWSIAPDWTEQFARRLFEARADDFIAYLCAGEWHDDWDTRVLTCVYPLAAWHDSPSLMGFDDETEAERLPITPDDYVCAVLASGCADTGVLVSRLDGQERVEVTSTDAALTVFAEQRRQLMRTNPWPDALGLRRALEIAPATMDAATFALVPYHVSFDEDFNEVVALHTPLAVPSMGGELALWVRRNARYDGEALIDVLLLGDNETRTPDEVFTALAPTAARLYDLVEDDKDSVAGLCIGPAPEAPTDFNYDGPAFFHTVGDTSAMGDPDYGSDLRVAWDGANVLVGMYGLAEPHQLIGEWDRAKG